MCRVIWKRSFELFLSGVLATLVASGSTFAFTTVIDTASGLEDDSYAAGRIVDNSMTMAFWDLNTTVSTTDFANDAITGGPNGLEYVMSNLTRESSDTNSIRYGVVPEVGYSVENIIVSQSPYSDGGTWNGGNAEAAQFVISWSGGGFAQVTDPDDQIFGFVTGTPIVSGTTVRYTGTQIFNSEDSWSIELPGGVNSVQVNWSSANPSPNSDLTREWVSFDAAIVAVPEPSLAVFALLSFFGVALVRRSRS